MERGRALASFLIEVSSIVLLHYMGFSRYRKPRQRLLRLRDDGAEKPFRLGGHLHHKQTKINPRLLCRLLRASYRVLSEHT